MKLYIVIAFHYSPERFRYLDRVLENLDDIETDESKVVIQTNTSKGGAVKTYPNLDLEVEIIDKLEDPYMLTWCHKQRMLDFLKTDYTHFAYLEDDMVLTQGLVNYWTETCDKFKSRGLNFIPGFFRIEHNKDGEWFSTDITEPIKVDDFHRLSFDEEMYISLPNPYQGCFFMDRELVEEHVKSPSFSFETCRKLPRAENDVRERANFGNMFENIPEGFNHRMLIPTDIFTVCWIHHCSDTYCNLPDNPNGKIPAEHIFTY